MACKAVRVYYDTRTQNTPHFREKRGIDRISAVLG